MNHWQLGHSSYITLLQGRPRLHLALWFLGGSKGETLTTKQITHLDHSPFVPDKGLEAQPPHLHGELKDDHDQRKQLQGSVDLPQHRLGENSSTAEATLLPLLFQGAAGFDSRLSIALWHAGKAQATLLQLT